MKGKYGGPMTVDDLYQALWQDREFFRNHGINHVNAAYLYFTACNEYGEAVLVYDRFGNTIDGYVSSGGYRSAADEFDKQAQLEAKPVTRKPSPTRVPFSPV